MGDVLAHLRSACGLRPIRTGLRDAFVPILFGCGFVGFALGPDSGFAGVTLSALALKALIEETVFRALLQNQIERLLPTWPATVRQSRFSSCTLTYISPGNTLVSLLFAIAHLPTQPVLAAFSTFVPALAFGLVWTRTRSLWLCAMLHLWYNIAYWH